MLHYVYITTNTINNKKYIGQRKCPKNKTPESDNYLGSGNLLIKAILKHGRKNFSKQIVKSNLTQKEADLIEIDLINANDATNNEMYYNIDAGGQYGRSDKHSSIISKSMKEFAKTKSKEYYIKNSVKAQIKIANSKGIKLPYNSYEEYIEHKIKLEKEIELRKIERRKEVLRIKEENKKQKEFKDWFNNTPIGKEIKKNKCKNAALIMWNDEKTKKSVLRKKKIASENYVVKKMRKENDISKQYLWNQGIREFKICGITNKLYNIKRSTRKIEVINRQSIEIYNICKEVHNKIIDLNKFKKLLIMQYIDN